MTNKELVLAMQKLATDNGFIIQKTERTTYGEISNTLEIKIQLKEEE